jgi:magnesium transporter
MVDMIKAYFSSLSSEEVKPSSLDRAGAWIDVENADETDLKRLIKIAGFSYADLKDGLDEYEMPRIERRNGKTIVIVRSPSIFKKGFYTETLMLAFTNKNLITISPYKNQMVDKVLKSGNREIVTTQKTKLTLFIFLMIANEFTSQLKKVRKSVVDLQEDWVSVKAQDIVRLTMAEEVLNQYLSVLIPMKNVFEIILSGTHLRLHEADGELFDDVLISIRQSVDVCGVSLKSIRSIRDAYQIIFTNRLNKAINMLTSLTVILTIPTIIGAFYGMNIGLPFSSSPFIFWWILSGSLVLSFLLLLVFWWKRWL